MEEKERKRVMKISPSTLAMSGKSLEQAVIDDKAKDFEEALHSMDKTYWAQVASGDLAKKLDGPLTPFGLKKKDEEELRKYLEDTQSMRVVALNEACEIAKDSMSHGACLTTQDITKMARAFAVFLIDGKA